MSFLVVCTTTGGDTYFDGNTIVPSVNFTKDRSAATKFDDRENASKVMRIMKRSWERDTLIDIDVLFWVEDDNKPKFAGNISALDSL